MAYLKLSIRDGFSDVLLRKLEAAGPKVAHALANEIAKDTEPFVPALTKSLANRTQIVDNQIIYPGPYARYLYEGKVMVDSTTGKGPMKIVGKDGSEVIRFRKGAKLRPTDQPLDIKTDVHEDATDHWLEASKIKNLDKWTRAAGRLVKDELED